MPDTKISNLTTATADDGLEIPVNAAGTTKKITLGDALAHSHDHVKAEITDFSHTHVKADITDFTHTHAAADVTDLQEVTEDRIASTIVAGTNLTGTYDDGAGTLTLDVDSHTHASTDITDFAEGVDDRVAALLTAGSGIGLDYDDVAGTLTIDGAAHTHTASDVTDFTESLQDAVNDVLIPGSNISLAYNDGAGTLSITATTGAGLDGWVDVRADYGAAGDGATDDRVAIMNAIAALDALGGGVLYFPPGTYMVGYNAGSRAGIYMASQANVHFRGAGMSVSIIKQVGGAYGASINFHLFNLDDDCSNISWADLTLDGNKDNITANDDASHLIEVEGNCSRLLMERVEFRDAVGDGIRLLGDPLSYNVRIVDVRGCYFYDCGRGGAVAQRGVERVRFIDNYFEGTQDQALSAEATGGPAPRYFLLERNIIEHSSAAVGIGFNGADTDSRATDIVLRNNIVRGTGCNFTRIDNLSIEGNTIHSDTSSMPVYVHGACNNVAIRNNQLEWSGAGTGGEAGVIHVALDSPALPEAITIEENSIRDRTSQAAFQRGIFFRGSGVVRNNQIVGNRQGTGIIASTPAANRRRGFIGIDGNTIQNFGSAIVFSGDADDLLRGLRIVNNRGENGDALLTDPNLGIGTVKTKIAYGAINYRLKGAALSILAGEVAFTATSHDIADTDTLPKETVYVVQVNSAGTVSIVRGDVAEAGEGVAPPGNKERVALGEVRVQHDGTAPFDATTDNLDAAHLTVTYTDYGVGVNMTTGLSFNTLSSYLDADGGLPVIYGNSFDSLVTTKLTGLGTATLIIGGSDGGIVNLSVSGAPSLAAPIGSMALRRDGGSGTAAYVNIDGTGTGWKALTHA